MINIEKAMRYLRTPAFPKNTVIILSLGHKVVTSSREKEDFFTEELIHVLKTLLVGKSETNPIEKVVDFKSDESIIKYFSDKLQVVGGQKLDQTKDIIDLLIPVELLYANKKQLSKELVSQSHEIKFKTFFMEVGFK